MNWDSVRNFFTTAGVDLLRGLVALAIGLFLVHWVMKLFERYEAKMKLEPTLRGFIKNLIRILLYVIVIMTAANTMGIPMTSIITLLGSAGVAISLAMQEQYVTERSTMGRRTPSWIRVTSTSQKMRDEIIGLGIIPVVEDWGKDNPNL